MGWWGFVKIGFWVGCGFCFLLNGFLVSAKVFFFLIAITRRLFVKNIFMFTVLCSMVCFGNLARAAEPVVETVKLSAFLGIFKCTQGAMAGACDNFNVPNPPPQISIALSECKQDTNSNYCSGTWTTTETREGHVFEGTIMVTKMTSSNGSGDFYALSAA